MNTTVRLLFVAATRTRGPGSGWSGVGGRGSGVGFVLACSQQQARSHQRDSLCSTATAIEIAITQYCVELFWWISPFSSLLRAYIAGNVVSVLWELLCRLFFTASQLFHTKEPISDNPIDYQTGH